MRRRASAYALALGSWVVLLAMAVLLGLVREALIAPFVGEQTAHVMGTLAFIAVMLVLIVWFVGRVQRDVAQWDLWMIGLVWMIMTIAFEFLFFHFVAGVPWDELLAEYNLIAGRLWVLILLTTLLGPALVGRLRSGA